MTKLLRTFLPFPFPTMHQSLIEKENIDFDELYGMVAKYNPEIAEAQRVNFPPDLKTA